MKWIAIAFLFSGCASIEKSPCTTEMQGAFIVQQFNETDQSDASLEILKDDFESDHSCSLEED